VVTLTLGVGQVDDAGAVYGGQMHGARRAPGKAEDGHGRDWVGSADKPESARARSDQPSDKRDRQ
jgi:hypothetical protein